MASPAQNMPMQPSDADALTRAVASGALAPVDEELWERRMRAMSLRNQGYTYSTIAAQCGVSPTVARADVRIARREILSGTTEDDIARQISVLRDCQYGAMALARNGDKDAIMAIVRCQEQEAKLKGLYAPTRQMVGISDVDFAEQAVALMIKAGFVPPRELMARVRGNTALEGMAASAAAARGASFEANTIESGEVIDGIVERIAGLGFDLPAFAFALDSEPILDTAISDAAVSAAAAAAIDPEQFGESEGGSAGWSNL